MLHHLTSNTKHLKSALGEQVSILEEGAKEMDIYRIILQNACLLYVYGEDHQWINIC